MRTIGDLIDHHHTIAVHCLPCRHSATLDLPKVAGKLGRDHSYLAADLLPRLKCGVCGSRRLQMTLQGQVPPLSVYFRSTGQ